MIDVELIGEANLARKLLEGRARAEAAMQARLEALAADMVEHAQALAPEDSGGLRDSIRWEPAEDGIGVVILAGGTPETSRPTSSGHVFDTAVLIEFGTSKMAAQPFFQPTLDAFRSRIEREVGEAAETAIVQLLEG